MHKAPSTGIDGESKISKRTLTGFPGLFVANPQKTVASPTARKHKYSISSEH